MQKASYQIGIGNHIVRDEFGDYSTNHIVKIYREMTRSRKDAINKQSSKQVRTYKPFGRRSVGDKGKYDWRNKGGTGILPKACDEEEDE